MRKDASNQTVIGYNVTGQADNSVVLGNADVTAIYMAQDKGATVHAAGADLSGSTGLILENDETITNSTDGTVLINGTVAGGTGSAAGVFTSNGDQDVTLFRQVILQQDPLRLPMARMETLRLLQMEVELFS